MITFSTGYLIFLTVISILKLYSLWFHLGCSFGFRLLTQNIIWKWNLILVSFDWDYRWRVLISVFSSKQIQYLKTDRANLKLVVDLLHKSGECLGKVVVVLPITKICLWGGLQTMFERRWWALFIEVIGNVLGRPYKGCR